MENTKTKAEVLAGVQASIGSIFTKEDVVGIIKSIKTEGGKGITKSQLIDALESIDLDAFTSKEIEIDQSELEITYDTDDNGNGGVIVTAEVDESSVENAVTVSLTLDDASGLAQEILDNLESED
jgi:outer membrane protein assembly factor BamA